MSKTFTYEVQKTGGDDLWSARDGVHIITMSDEWTSEMIAQHAARDHEKTASDDSWRVVVWNGDDVHEQLWDPDWVIYGRELADECWCHPLFIQDGKYEWYCPSHGDRSWRPKAKAFQNAIDRPEAHTDGVRATTDQLAEFKVQVWAGMNPMSDADPPRLGIRLTHDGCRGFSVSFSALPSSNVPVPRLLAVIDEHLAEYHPEIIAPEAGA